MKNSIKIAVICVVAIAIAVVSFNMGVDHGIDRVRDSELEHIESMEIGDSYDSTSIDSDVWWTVTRTR